MPKKNGRQRDQHQKFQQQKQSTNYKVPHDRPRLGLNSTFKLSKQSKRLIAACDSSVRSDLLYLLKEAEQAALSFKNRRESSKKENSDES